MLCLCLLLLIKQLPLLLIWRWSVLTGQEDPPLTLRFDRLKCSILVLYTVYDFLFSCFMANVMVEPTGITHVSTAYVLLNTHTHTHASQFPHISVERCTNMVTRSLEHHQHELYISLIFIHTEPYRTVQNVDRRV